MFNLILSLLVMWVYPPMFLTLLTMFSLLFAVLIILSALVFVISNHYVSGIVLLLCTIAQIYSFIHLYFHSFNQLQDK